MSDENDTENKPATLLRLPTLVGGYECVCDRCSAPFDVVSREGPRSATLACPRCRVIVTITVPETP